jgi:two-component sensor histidine kinase
MAMAVHELATNAARYGALAGAGGQVQIHWRVADDALVFHWTEVGGAPVNAPTHRGVGTTVIERAVRQLNGRLELDWRAEGLACQIATPR